MLLTSVWIERFVDADSPLFPLNARTHPLSYSTEIDWGSDGFLLFFYEINLIRLLIPHFLFSHKSFVLSNEFAILLSLKMVYFFPGILGDRRQTPSDIDVSRTAPTLGLNQVMDEGREWNASL